MNNLTWDSTFRELFERCATLHRSGKTHFTDWFTEADQAFLKSIGYTGQEFFDFVDDHCRYGEPSLETALLVAAVRRDYFTVVQDGQASTKTVPPSDLPAKTDAVDGIEWLPRLIAKARAKLRGEMDPDIMFGCGGDRAFFKEHNLHPADFLRFTWAADEDDRKIIDYVKSASGKA